MTFYNSCFFWTVPLYLRCSESLILQLLRCCVFFAFLVEEQRHLEHSCVLLNIWTHDGSRKHQVPPYKMLFPTSSEKRSKYPTAHYIPELKKKEAANQRKDSQANSIFSMSCFITASKRRRDFQEDCITQCPLTASLQLLHIKARGPECQVFG